MSVRQLVHTQHRFVPKCQFNYNTSIHLPEERPTLKSVLASNFVLNAMVAELSVLSPQLTRVDQSATFEFEVPEPMEVLSLMGTDKLGYSFRVFAKRNRTCEPSVTGCAYLVYVS